MNGMICFNVSVPKSNDKVQSSNELRRTARKKALASSSGRPGDCYCGNEVSTRRIKHCSLGTKTTQTDVSDLYCHHLDGIHILSLLLKSFCVALSQRACFI